MRNYLTILSFVLSLSAPIRVHSKLCSVNDFSDAFAAALAKNSVPHSQVTVGMRRIFDPRTKKWVNIPETAEDIIRKSQALLRKAKAQGNSGKTETGFVANSYRLSAQANGMKGNFSQLRADYSESARYYKSIIGNKKTPAPPRNSRKEYPPRLYTDYVDMSVSAGNYSDALEVVTPQSLADFVGRSKGMMPNLQRAGTDNNVKFMNYLEAYNQRRFQIEAIKKYGNGNPAYSSLLKEAEDHAQALHRDLEGMARGL